MTEIKRFIGLGFDMFVIPEQDATENGYECIFHKIVDEETPISADYCDEPVRFAVARMDDEDMVVMCHEHFQQFANDMAEALGILADQETFDREPKIMVHTERKVATTNSAIVNLASAIKRQMEQR